MPKELAGINIDKELLLEFKIYCVKNKITMKKKIEELIREELNKNK